MTVIFEKKLNIFYNLLMNIKNKLDEKNLFKKIIDFVFKLFLKKNKDREVKKKSKTDDIYTLW